MKKKQKTSNMKAWHKIKTLGRLEGMKVCVLGDEIHHTGQIKMFIFLNFEDDCFERDL